MAWTPKFTKELFQKVQCNPRKEALRIALLSAKSEVEGAEACETCRALAAQNPDTPPSTPPGAYFCAALMRQTRYALSQILPYD